jgi:hypothetical protein
MMFEGLSPERYETLVQTVKAQGLELTGVAGSTTFQGMDFTWSYVQESCTLTIQCTSKLFFVPCSMIEERIRAVVG